MIAAPASTGAPPTNAAAPPAAALVVPGDFRARLDAAMHEGRSDAFQFAREHPAATDRALVADWALLRMAFAPKDDDEDLAYLHRVARTRTDAGVARARYWSDHGLTSEWDRLLDQYAASAGPAQALAARRLLNDSLMLVNRATQVAKSSNARARPFVVDPKLPLALDRPGNNPSYPSGHTSAAYAACLVLAHLMPDRATEFLDMAREASWARVYGGVHFPTDVVAGAKLAATVAEHLVRSSGVPQLRGTAPS